MRLKKYVVAFILSVSLALSGTALGMHGQNGMHWPDGLREVQVVDHTCMPNVQTAIGFAVDRWNNVRARLRLTAVNGECSSNITYDGSKIGVWHKRTCRGIACAGFWYDHQHHLNSSHITIADPGRHTQEKLNRLITHEVGHGIGLGHSTRKTSVMCPTSCTSRPDAHDIAQLRANYNHDDPKPVVPVEPTTTTSTSTTTTTIKQEPPRPCRIFFGYCLLPN